MMWKENGDMKLLRTFAAVGLLTLGLIGTVPAAVGAEEPGASPTTALALSAASSGSLSPNQTRWYQFSGDGSSPIGVTMDFAPPNGPSVQNVYFNVESTIADGAANADWPGWYRLGQGTSSGLPLGRRYWFSGTSSKATYDVEVVNTSDQSISYGLGLTGSVFPPPYQSLTGSSAPPPASALPVLPPAATVPSVVSPPAVAPVTPASSPNSVTDRSGLTLIPQITVESAFSTIAMRLESGTSTQVHIDRVMIRPPQDAVVDGISPTVSQNENGVAWYANVLVNQDNPLTGYWVRVFGPANGAIVEVDWSTSSDKGALIATISGAPSPSTTVP
jgi:hypothetical protein